MSTLASRIKQARKQAGLTQKDLAQRVGVSQPVISQLENGENLQSVHLLAIAKACGVDSEWLASGEEAPQRVVLTKEQLDQLISDVWERGFGWGALGGLEFKHTEAYYAFRQMDLQELGDSVAVVVDHKGQEVGYD